MDHGAVNPDAYLGGGRYFATFPGGANIFPRNLTPDNYWEAGGRPHARGIHEHHEDRPRLRRGASSVSPDRRGRLHPGASATPLNGNVVQILPWPVFSHMSDDDLKAIYEYLTAIPCISLRMHAFPSRRTRRACQAFCTKPARRLAEIREEGRLLS